MWTVARISADMEAMFDDVWDHFTLLAFLTPKFAYFEMPWRPGQGPVYFVVDSALFLNNVCK